MTEVKLIKNKNKVVEIEGYKVNTYEIEYIERIKGLYGFIYVTTNLINGKMYVGQRRIKTYDNQWKNYYGSGVVIKKALEKYGKENFDRKIIDIAFNEQELNNLEKFYTIKFNVIDKNTWYNLCYGGGGSSGHKLSMETKKKISINCGSKHRDCSWTERSKQKHKEYYEKYGCPTAKKVAQYDLEGYFVRVYDSATEAGKEHNIGKSSIASACTGRLVTSCGYQWRYCNKDGSYMDKIDSCHEYIDDVQNKYSKMTAKYDLNGNFIAVYKSATEAANSIGAKNTSICKVCNGDINTCYDYQFRYCDENGNYPEKIAAYIPEPQKRTNEFKEKMSQIKCKKVNQYTMDNVFIKTFNSGKDTVEVGAYPNTVSRCCNGFSKHSGGFKWFYANDPNQPDKTKIILKEE